MEVTQIGTLNLKTHKGKAVALEGIVDTIVQTGGPTVFTLIDGSGSLPLKGFEGPGVRAYPDIKEGDIIHVTIRLGEFQDAPEGEISRIQKLAPADTARVRQRIEFLERKRAEVKPQPFMVQSSLLEKLKDRFFKAATEIRLAIVKNRPVIVRHHNDADGYSAGYALERAIIPLINKQHGGGKAPWEYYTRAPCAAPFYDIEDSIKDAAHSLADAAKFSNKMPLVIIVDTGSGEDDVISIKQGKIHGMDFIVIDHHYFEKDLISSEVLVHINPFLIGEDGRKCSAGMLCTELSRLINPELKGKEYIAALSGLADRIDNPSMIDSYIEIAAEQGYTKQLLHDIGALIDFISTKLRFMEAREYISVVFGDPIEQQKVLVSLLVPHIRKLESRSLSIARAASKQEYIGKNLLQVLPVEEAFSRNVYPKPGKALGMVHDEIQGKNKEKKVISIGLLSDALIIRATQDSNFSVHEFLQYLNKNAPEAYAEGGGHHLAGSIKFVPAKQDIVLKSLRKFISSLK